MKDVNYTAKNCYVMSCPSCHVFMNMSGESIVKNERVRCYKCGAQSKAKNWRPVVRHEPKH